MKPPVINREEPEIGFHGDPDSAFRAYRQAKIIQRIPAQWEVEETDEFWEADVYVWFGLEEAQTARDQRKEKYGV